MGTEYESSEYNVNIGVVGVGGQGSNLVNRLTRAGIKSAKTIAVNTDANHLNMINAHRRMLIGNALTKGLGAGGFPEVGAKAAEASKQQLIEALEGFHMVFVAFGLGGGTGGGAGPVVARLAKEAGALVVGFVTYPFALERSRKQKAEWSLEQLQNAADTVIVIENNRLLSYVPNLPIDKAFELVDNVAGNVIKGIADTIQLPSLINLDFADIRAVMAGAGTAVINIGYGSGPDKVDAAIRSTINHPLLDVDLENAKNALVHVTGGKNLTIEEATRIGAGVTQSLDPKANVIFGARLSEEMLGQVSVMSIVTGVKPKFGVMPSGVQKDAAFLTGLEIV